MPTTTPAPRFSLDYLIAGPTLAVINDPSVPAEYRRPLAVYNNRRALYALPAATAHTLIEDITAALQFLYDAGRRAERSALLRRSRVFRNGGNITGAALYRVLCTLCATR